ncbi:MAG TPA: YihY/virulence factor BrkB family protein [Cytophagaceae bacterium]|jgi:membrane protein|nr:YihY/virulence factor BrkB family protein [Cytophagaceae bacterium]
MKKLREYFTKTRIYRSLHKGIQRTYVTEQQISLQRVLEIFIAQVKKDNLTERASSMAFNFTLSIFPSIIFLFTLIPYIPVPNLTEDMLGFLQENIPASIYDVTASTILDIIKIPHGGLLSFGFIFALFSATNGIRGMIQAFNRCYKTADNRSFVKVTLLSCCLAVFLSLIILAAVVISIIVKLELNEIEGTVRVGGRFFYYLLIISRLMLIFMIFFFAISMIYYLAPTVIVRWSFFSVGSLIAALLSLTFTVAFFYYINNFNSYNKVYGSIGAIIGVMMWIYFISIVLLIGFEINASIDMARHEVKNPPLKDAVMPV